MSFGHIKDEYNKQNCLKNDIIHFFFPIVMD